MAKCYFLNTIALALILLQNSDGTSIVSRVTNGEEASPGEFPFVVSVTYNDEHICGGFIYDSQHVVTAASCIYGKDTSSSLAVVVGQVNLIQFDPDERRCDISHVYIYEDYDPTIKLHDLALIKITSRFEFGPYVNIGYYNEVNATISNVTIMGWGYYNEGGPISTRLLKATVTLTDDGCRVFGEEEYQPNYMVCAGDSAVDTSEPCLYDEGSPLLQGSNIIGIMSKNLGCQYAPDFPPTIYTRLSAYFVWLQRIAGAQPIPSADY